MNAAPVARLSFADHYAIQCDVTLKPNRKSIPRPGNENNLPDNRYLNGFPLMCPTDPRAGKLSDTKPERQLTQADRGGFQ